MGGVQALPPQDGAFLAVGGVLVLGDDRQFVLRAEHSSRRSWCGVGRRGRGVGLVIGWGGHVHKDLRSRPWPGTPVLTLGVSTQSGKEGSTRLTRRRSSIAPIPPRTNPYPTDDLMSESDAHSPSRCCAPGNSPTSH